MYLSQVTISGSQLWVYSSIFQEVHEQYNQTGPQVLGYILLEASQYDVLVYKNTKYISKIKIIKSACAPLSLFSSQPEALWGWAVLPSGENHEPPLCFCPQHTVFLHQPVFSDLAYKTSLSYLCHRSLLIYCKMLLCLMCTCEPLAVYIPLVDFCGFCGFW